MKPTPNDHLQPGDKVEIVDARAKSWVSAGYTIAAVF